MFLWKEMWNPHTPSPWKNIGTCTKNYKLPHPELAPPQKVLKKEARKSYNNGQKMTICVSFQYFFVFLGTNPGYFFLHFPAWVVFVLCTTPREIATQGYRNLTKPFGKTIAVKSDAQKIKLWSEILKVPMVVDTPTMSDPAAPKCLPELTY